ncbi:MAG: sulfite exporter TauE/SafE family protein, partial [Pseudomonadota bacterium]
PLALIYQDRDPRHARPTLSAFFAIGCIVSFGGLVIAGWAGVDDLVRAAIMAPAMVAGILVARRMGGRFDKRFRPMLLTMAGLAAMILIGRGLA